MTEILKLIQQNKLMAAYKEVRRQGRIIKDFSFENENGSYRLIDIFFDLTDYQVLMHNGDVLQIDTNTRRF